MDIENKNSTTYNITSAKESLSSSPPPTILANMFIFDVSFSSVHTRVFNTILKLNICDLIEDGPKSANELSNLTGVSKESIIRMCRFFVPHGLFIQESNGDQLDNPIFKKTTHSTLFTQSGGLKYYSLYITSDFIYKANTGICDLLITGKNQFEILTGQKNIWDAMKNEPHFQEIFNKAMVEFSTAQSQLLANSIDWSNYNQIIDVGGNKGVFLETILKLNPSIKGINFDLDNVINSPQVVNHSSITNVAGNFFESVPSSDCYILKYILHDWDDESCIQILNNIHKSIKDGGKVIVFELVLDQNKTNQFPLIFDIFLWNIFNGKERELFQFQSLANKAGFKLESSIDCGYEHCLILSKSN